MGQGTGKRILFVDDEASIRLTLPPILQKAGFDVHVAENVGDAIFEINSHQFDVLISDLNIGEEGDGFLVTTAMRHIQPDCATFILTGYPAFETALQAIHSQVDDYLVKPVEVESLISTLNEKLVNRLTKTCPARPLSALLMENAASIVDATVNAIKADAKTSAPSFSSAELTNYLRIFINALAAQLERKCDELNGDGLRSAAEHGTAFRQKKGASVRALASEFRHFGEAIYQSIQSNLTSIDGVTALLSDLRRLNRGVNLLLERSLEGFGKKVTPASRSNR